MATVYLSPSGSDSRTYAEAQNPATPWATVAKVNSSAVSGDTAILAAGTYAFATITWSKNITLTGATGIAGDVILDGSNGDVRWNISNRTISLNSLTIRNIQRGGTYYEPTFDFSNNTSDSIFSATNVIFKNIVISGNSGYGIFQLSSLLSGTSIQRLTLLRCAFIDCGSPANAGAICHHGGNNESRRYITMNRVSFVFNSASTYPRAIFVASFGAGTQITIKNSIVANHSGQQLDISETLSGSLPTIVASYSGFYLCTGAPSGTAVLTSDPKYIDPAGGNLRLQPDSPYIGFGTNL